MQGAPAPQAPAPRRFGCFLRARSADGGARPTALVASKAAPENTAQKDKVADLEAQLEQLRARARESQAREKEFCENWQRAADQREAELRTALDRALKAESGRAELEVMGEKLLADLDQAQAKADAAGRAQQQHAKEAKEMVDSLQTRVDEADRSQAQLREDLTQANARAESAERTVVELRSGSQALSAELQAKTQEIAELTAEVGKAKTESQAFSVELRAKTEEVTQLTAEVCKTKTDNQALTVEIQSKTAEIAQLTDEVGKTKVREGDSQRAVAELQHSTHVLNTQVQTLTQASADAKREVDEARVWEETLTQERDMLKEMVARLKEDSSRALGRAEAAETASTTSREAAEKMRAEVKAKAKQLAEQEAMNSTLKAELDDAKKAVEDLRTQTEENANKEITSVSTPSQTAVVIELRAALEDAQRQASDAMTRAAAAEQQVEHEVAKRLQDAVESGARVEEKLHQSEIENLRRQASRAIEEKQAAELKAADEYQHLASEVQRLKTENQIALEELAKQTPTPSHKAAGHTVKVKKEPAEDPTELVTARRKVAELEESNKQMQARLKVASRLETVFGMNLEDAVETLCGGKAASAQAAPSAGKKNGAKRART